MAANRLNEFNQPIGAALPDWTPPVKPPATPITGAYCTLQPLDPTAHSKDLWAAFGQSDARQWTYLLSDAPKSEDELHNLYQEIVGRADYATYAIVSNKTGKPVGTASYLNIVPKNGDIEIGNLNFSASLKKTCQSTETIYVMLKRALDELGYRRVVWKCDSLNEASRNAALRFGFTFEGIHRNHMVIKGRSRNTAWFSITDTEWPAIRDTFNAWLDPANFDEQGAQKKRLADLMPPRIALF